MKLSLLSALLASTAAAAPHLEPRAAKYEGYKVLRMDTGDKLEDVKQMLSAFDYEEWSHEVSKHIDFSLPADQAKKLKGLGAKFTEMHSDLGKDIAYEGRPGKYKGKKGKGPKKGPKGPKGPKKPEPLPDLSWYDSYHSYDEHLEYLDDLAAAFPKNSEVFVAGHSLEGREQKGIHIWGKHKNRNNAILWHGTVHAREWITTMTVEYLAYQLIAGYGKDSNVTSFVDDYDFYLLPIVNPDGFVYTQTNDRLWRKNRAPPLPGANQSEPCWGVDLNRNWPHEWVGPGSSNNSCTQTYRGPSPGSEPEMSGMQHFADKLADSHGLKLFIDWHSYSQLILSPYGYSCEAVAETNEEHIDLMAATADAIQKVEGTTYVTGPTCTTIYATNGGSSDYVYDISGSEWSLAFELRDTGTYGFILPPEQILPNCEEIWAGMQVMLSMI